ncbi:unnamed protein product [Cyprideis torosa]|uniref:Uncharacterized protein n=1 Tax=Cyprideis torosa TaxID=163714 RepID=A0A7R8ZS30_9CRUS|nr:unnamed protein product [Cyprideis torosa]CAG0895296.1 unnamed protein product [Cyprideis torosa]
MAWSGLQSLVGFDRALMKSDEARKSATQATDKVQEGLDAVLAIQRELRQINSIDESELTKLEEKFERAKEKIIQANLNETLSVLKTARSRQKQWTENLEENVLWLRKEVDTIEAIRNSLPRMSVGL